MSRAVPVNADGRHAIDELVAWHRQHYKNTLSSRSPQFLGGELKKTADETLFLELTLRGYDLSKLRDEPTTAEIVKIG